MEFKLSIIASLARQLGYTPRSKRLAQLANTEALLLRIQPETAYPVGYVVHALTGYRPKHEDAAAAKAGGGAAELLTGVALQHDLGILLETVSDAMDLSTLDPDLAGEPILSIEDVCDRFGVTSKTIQRWRRKGLPARRFLFNDGPDAARAKKRVGFRLSCVEQFVARQDGSAQRPAGIDPLTAEAQDAVISHARRLIAGGHDRHEVVRRVARRVGRSSLAVLHTLEQYPRFSSEKPLLANAADALDGVAAQQVFDRLGRGETITQIARDIDRPKASIYRVWIDAKAESLATATVKYHDDPLYHSHDPLEAEQQVNELVRQAESAFHSLDDDSRRNSKPPRGLPPYLTDLYRTPLLTAALERSLFLQFNYHKCRFAELRSTLDPHLCARQQLARLDRHLAASRRVKNRIVTANLRLVVSVARKHCRPGLDIMELVSDGNIVLMRAVDGFDVHRGFKFSTYGTLALMKGYARSVPAMQAQRTHTTAIRLDPAIADAEMGRVAVRDEIEVLLERLDTRERDAIEAHWGLRDDRGEVEMLQSATPAGVEKIQFEAFAKLRRLAELSASDSF